MLQISIFFIFNCRGHGFIFAMYCLFILVYYCWRNEGLISLLNFHVTFLESTPSVKIGDRSEIRIPMKGSMREFYSAGLDKNREMARHVIGESGQGGAQISNQTLICAARSSWCIVQKHTSFP